MNIQIHILPKTVMGKWSVSLAIIGILLTVVSMVLVAMGHHLDVDAPWVGAVLSFAIFAAFATGLIAFIRSKERGITVYLGLGLLILLFVLGEFLFPH